MSLRNRGICLAAAPDRAAREGAEPDSPGVGTVAAVGYPVYLPGHTVEYLRSREIRPDTLWREG